MDPIEDPSEDSDDDSEPDDRGEVTLWFDKIAPLLTIFRTVSLSLIVQFGTYIAIDEMMIRFFGRSHFTHRMKNKPVKEGYKWFVMADSKTSYVYNITPDGRTAGNNGRGADEVVIEEGDGKILSCIKHLVQPLVEETKKTGKKFIIAMDNYFTLPRVCKMLRDYTIGVVGTGRFRSGWPGKHVTEIDASQVTFNELFWSVDEFGTMLLRWMDNGLVFMVTTVHTIMDIAFCSRKKPRVTDLNKRHVDKVWGKFGTYFIISFMLTIFYAYNHILTHLLLSILLSRTGKVCIWIPQAIDDYNHWMCGVDLCDQKVAYYHPDLRCYRNWIPMFLQLLSLIRVNCYIIYLFHHPLNKEKGTTYKTHKDFTMAIVTHLMDRAKFEIEKSNARKSKTQKRLRDYTEIIDRTDMDILEEFESQQAEEEEEPPKKRRRATRTSFKNVQRLPVIRLQEPRHLHVMGKLGGASGRPGCEFCKFMWKTKKYYGRETGTFDKDVKRTTLGCLHCDVPLCKNHFNIFHDYDSTSA